MCTDTYTQELVQWEAITPLPHHLTPSQKIKNGDRVLSSRELECLQPFFTHPKWSIKLQKSSDQFSLSSMEVLQNDFLMKSLILFKIFFPWYS